MTTSRFDVAVLGVGGMGAAALAHLAARGCHTIGIEQDEVPSLRGSSVGQSRIIRKAYFEDARYVPLLHRAYELWRELEEAESPEEPLFVRTGCLNLGPPDHPSIEGVRTSVREHSLPHEVLDEAAVRRRFPAFVPAPGNVGIYEGDAGYLRVEACTAAHARRAVAAGAELRTRATVHELRVGRTVELLLETGETIEVDRVVVSAGPWLPGAVFASLARALPPLVVTRQVQLWFSPRTTDPMPAFIHFLDEPAEGRVMDLRDGDRAYYGLPPVGPQAGIKVCRHHGGAPTAPETLDRELRPEDEADVRSYIDAHLPVASGPLVAARVCMYTSTPDQHFVVGVHPEWSNVIVLGGFSGHGYKMASVIGEVAADLVERGTSRHDITLFAPTRFAAR